MIKRPKFWDEGHPETRVNGGGVMKGSRPEIYHGETTTTSLNPLFGCTGTQTKRMEKLMGSEDPVGKKRSHTLSKGPNGPGVCGR